MYNRDVIGTRHNPGEKALGKDNVGQLVEKWRFPPADSSEKIGVVHATVVVNGHVYFGTETTPTFYKLTPDGKVKWAYRPAAADHAGARAAFGLPTAGFINAALVTSDTVYVGDMGGTIYALDRATGKERWKIDTRAAPFPGAHSSNCIFAAPILAEGMVVVAGGGLRARRRRRSEEPRLHRPRLRRRSAAGQRQGRLEVRRRPRAARSSTRP